MPEKVTLHFNHLNANVGSLTHYAVYFVLKYRMSKVHSDRKRGDVYHLYKNKLKSGLFKWTWIIIVYFS